MKILLSIILALASFSSLATAPSGPPVATQTVLSDELNRLSYYGLVVQYLEKAIIYDIAEHYSYLQGKDTSSLALSNERIDLMLEKLDRLHRVQRIKTTVRPAVNVTCQAPPAEGGGSE